MASIGWVFGAIGAAFLAHVLSGMVLDVATQSWGAWSLVVIVMVIATTLACTVPALRAAHTDPIRALRYD
jgi:ABC-type lipoprotein release transport system permease subunit